MSAEEQLLWVPENVYDVLLIPDSCPFPQAKCTTVTPLVQRNILVSHLKNTHWMQKEEIDMIVDSLTVKMTESQRKDYVTATIASGKPKDYRRQATREES